MHVSLWCDDFNSFSKILRKEITELNGTSSFSFLKRLSIMISIVVCHFILLTEVEKGSDQGLYKACDSI